MNRRTGANDVLPTKSARRRARKAHKRAGLAANDTKISLPPTLQDTLESSAARRGGQVGKRSGALTCGSGHPTAVAALASTGRSLACNAIVHLGKAGFVNAKSKRKPVAGQPVRQASTSKSLVQGTADAPRTTTETPARPCVRKRKPMRKDDESLAEGPAANGRHQWPNISSNHEFEGHPVGSKHSAADVAKRHRACLEKALKASRKRHRKQLGADFALDGWTVADFASFTFEKLLRNQMSGEVEADDRQVLEAMVAGVTGAAHERHHGRVSTSISVLPRRPQGILAQSLPELQRHWQASHTRRRCWKGKSPVQVVISLAS